MIRSLAALLMPATMIAQSVAGNWHTKQQEAAVEIQITKSGRGYTGQLRNMDYPDAAVPLTGIVVQRGNLHFEVPVVKATFQGTLKDGTTLEGTWTQPGIQSTIRFERGNWTPTLASGNPFPPNLDIQVRMPPTPFPAGGAYHSVYELHLNNFGSRWIDVRRVEVWGSERLMTLEGESLASAIAGSSSTIEGGKRAILMLWLKTERPPTELRHKVLAQFAGYRDVVEMDGGPVPVESKPAVLGPPLKGENWKAFAGPSPGSHHRKALGAFEGRFTVAQRFAIDFARIGPDGKPFTGEGLNNQDHHAWGAEVIAVSDGVVVAAADGTADSTPTLERSSENSNQPDVASVAGNSATIEVGPGCYAHYVHLQSGSLRVKAGDRVRKGEVIGALGNSGNSTGPHLHFQVTNGPSLLGSEGIPYVFDRFSQDGVTHLNEIPLRDWVIHFP